MLWASEAAVQSSLTVIASGGSAALAAMQVCCVASRCAAPRRGPLRPFLRSAQWRYGAVFMPHMSFACLQMPDELSAMIQGIVRERVRRNWPLVRAFEIRSGRRSLQQGEFVAVIRVMPCIGADSRTDTREPLWFGKGAGLLGSGRRGGDAHRIQWLQHTTFKGSSCWMESSSNGPAPTSSIVAAGFHLNPIHLPNRRPYARQFSATCSGALPALSVPTAVVQMLACACENACAGHGADVRCWILTGVTVSARRKRRRAQASLEADLLAESSMFVAESDGCPSQFACSNPDDMTCVL